MSMGTGRGGAGVWSASRWALAALLLSLAGLLQAKEATTKPAKEAKAAKEAEPAGTEIEGRRVLLPPDLNLDLAWYSPVVSEDAGKILRGWVVNDLVLLETEKKNLIAVKREDGTERWRCVLDEPIRYEPAVSNANVVVNVKNFLVAIEKQTGEIRWRLLPSFVMSAAPVVIDPPSYPRAYGKEWTKLESIYVGAWEGRFYSVTVRGRMTWYAKGREEGTGLAAPEFDLMNEWHKAQVSRGLMTTTPQIWEDSLYYAADDQYVYSVNREASTVEPYRLQGAPSTILGVNSNNLYVGSRDFFLHALDRFSLTKKWSYPLGGPPTGFVYPDVQTNPASYVYCPTESLGVHALRVYPSKTPARGGGMMAPEYFEPAWIVSDADGTITASPATVYLGQGRQKGFEGFARMMAVDKESGKVQWRSGSQGVRFYLPVRKAVEIGPQGVRIYAVTEDNRLLAFKEKRADAGPLVEKPPAPPAPPANPKIKGQAQARPEEKQ